MASKKEGNVTVTIPESKKARKPKSPARWAVLKESTEGGFDIAIDNQPTEREAKLAAATFGVTGKILVVCIHAEATAEPVSQVKFNWTK